MITTANIAGAGLGGLASALALSKIGVRVSVFEQALALTEVGAGIQLSPNAMHVARWLGIDDQVIRVGFEPETALIRDYRTGKRYMNAPLTDMCQRRYGAPYIHIHRADLLMILTEAAVKAGVVIETGADVQGYDASRDRAAFLLGEGLSADADLLIGADGLGSKVREQMLGAEAPEFTGQVAWRGLIPAHILPDGLVAPGATVWAGPGRHFVTYYVRGGDLVNIVAVEERADWRDESWTHPGDPAALRTVFDGWHPDVTTLIDHLDQCFLWALFGRKPLPTWSDGPVALLGDACHPMLPFMAHGAAMAFEDAFVLAKCVEANPSLTSALQRYEDLRKPRATKIQAKARANADLFHMNGLRAKASLHAASLLPARTALAPLDWIYGFDPTQQPTGAGWRSVT